MFTKNFSSNLRKKFLVMWCDFLSTGTPRRVKPRLSSNHNFINVNKNGTMEQENDGLKKLEYSTNWWLVLRCFNENQCPLATRTYGGERPTCFQQLSFWAESRLLKKLRTIKPQNLLVPEFRIAAPFRSKNPTFPSIKTQHCHYCIRFHWYFCEFT